VIILGSGPNRIGQGIEFDYCCVHAAFALREAGYETVMVNCNPETVSTDYDTSDRLYFEPLTFEDVLEVCHAERRPDRSAGVIVQLGGQTPARARAARSRTPGVPIVGTSPEAIDLAEDRGAFGAVLADAGLPAPRARHGDTSYDEARRGRRRDRLPGAGPPVVRARRPRHGDRLRRRHARGLHHPRDRGEHAEHPVLVDRFLDDAIEIDVDALSTAPSSTSAASWSTSRRPASTPATRRARCRRSRWAAARSTASAVDHRGDRPRRRGARAAQRPVRAGGDVLYVLEANPRASRTVPFVSKATAVPLAKAAARVMLGATIAELRAEGMLPDRRRRHAAAGRADRGQGGGAAVQPVPLPRRRHGARPGDALDRRGDGHRRGLFGTRSPSRRPRRTAGCRPRARCSSRWPTATSARWSSR
jgi:carbamoyl-phosphate synthase large subunit